MSCSDSCLALIGLVDRSVTGSDAARDAELTREPIQNRWLFRASISAAATPVESVVRPPPATASKDGGDEKEGKGSTSEAAVAAAAATGCKRAC